MSEICSCQQDDSNMDLTRLVSRLNKSISDLITKDQKLWQLQLDRA